MTDFEKLVYVAAPYRVHGDGLQPVTANSVERQEKIRAANATLVTRRLMIAHPTAAFYSPLTHNHPIHEIRHETAPGNLDRDYYLSHGLHMLSLCDELWVVMLPGWTHSTGIQAERGLARDLDMPQYVVHPNTLRLHVLEQPLGGTDDVQHTG